MFLCLQTKKKDCDHLVTLFILYQKKSNRKFCLILSAISITWHQKYGVHSTKYYCKSSNPLRQKKLSKQTIVSVNRLGHEQLKGNLEKKMALMKLEDIVQQEDAMATEFCDDKIISKNVFAMKIHCFMMKTKIKIKKSL